MNDFYHVRFSVMARYGVKSMDACVDIWLKTSHPNIALSSLFTCREEFKFSI